MAKQTVVIARHRAVLEQLGLTTIEGAKAFEGELIKRHNRGRRDIFRVRVRTGTGQELTLFLKRNWRPYKKDGLTSVMRRGRVWSVARQEWEHSQAIADAGLRTAALVAYGEEKGALWEHFSYLVTEAAAGEQTLQEFLRSCADPTRRRAVFTALAREIRRLHDAGLATPDLFSRHIFLGWREGRPQFCLIDMARVNVAQPMPDRLRARDLAALNVTAPLRFVSLKERLRFLQAYEGNTRRRLRRLIEARIRHLLTNRRKFADYQKAPESGK